MGLETANFISELVPTNPLSSDPEAQGDDHLRNLKTALQGSFPNSDRAFRIPEFLAKAANYTILTTDENKVINCSTSAGAFTLTLPTPTFDGWRVDVVKTSTDTNPVYVSPPSGTINGFAKIRVNVPFVVHTFLWTGSSFIRVAPAQEPAGCILDFFGATAPVGYVFCYGQTLPGVIGDYPELAATVGSLVMPDLRGRVVAGKDDMGGADANLITTAISGFEGSTLGATGGSQSHTLIESELPTLNKGVTFSVASISPPPGFLCLSWNGTGANVRADSADINVIPALQVSTTTPTLNLTASVSFGGGNGHRNMQPTIIANKILRLC